MLFRRSGVVSQHSKFLFPARFGSNVQSHTSTTHIPSHNNTSYPQYTDEYIKDQLPKEGIFIEKAQGWISKYWRPDRDDILCNDHPHRFAAYNWFQNTPLGSKSIVKLLASMFERTQLTNEYESETKVHENSVFLYKSDAANKLLRGRWIDYGLTAGLPIILLGMNKFLWIGYIYFVLTFPMRSSVLRHFTIRADLLPHSEQVQFVKGGFYGKPKKYLVDIKNLKKVSSEVIPNSFLAWMVPQMDKNMIFKDMASGEFFVMDTWGLWNKEGINHPLIK